MGEQIAAQADVSSFNGTHVAQVFHPKEPSADIGISQEQQHGQQ